MDKIHEKLFFRDCHGKPHTDFIVSTSIIIIIIIITIIIAIVTIVIDNDIT